MNKTLSIVIATTIALVFLLVCPGVASARQLAVIDGKVVTFDGPSNKLWINEKRVPAKYPKMALRKRLDGCVAVAFIIESDGTTRKHRVLANSGTTVFNYSAIEAAKQLRYSPTEINPEMTPVIVANVYTYQLNEGNRANKETREELNKICWSGARKALEPLTAKIQE